MPGPTAVTPVVAMVRRLAAALTTAGVTAREVAGVAGGAVRDDGAPLGLRAPVGDWGELAVTRQWRSDAPAVADLELYEPVALADLESAFGAGRPVPRLHPGPRTVAFQEAGIAGALIMALGDGESVRVVRVRAA